MSAIANTSPVDRSLRRLKRRVRRSAPILGWLVALGVALVLAQSQPPQTLARGVAEPASRTAAADSAGLLRTISVRVHQQVEAGDVLATLDDSLLLARIRRARAQLERIVSQRDLELARDVAKSVRRRVELDDDGDWRRRRLQRDVESARLALLRTHAELEEDRLVLAGLVHDLSRVEGLIAKGVASRAKGDQLKTRAAALQEKIARTADVSRQLETELREAVERRSADTGLAATPDVSEAMARAPWRWALEEQQAQLDMLALERARLEIRAPSSGRVAEVHAHVGQVLGRGEALFTIVEDVAESFVAYAPAPNRDPLLAGQRVQVRSDSGVVTETTVASVGPSFVRKPTRLWTRSDQPEWALPLSITPTDPPFARPGEAFSVRFVRSPASPSLGVAASAATATR